MIHDLTVGYLDPVAIRNRQAVALRPLDPATVACVLAGFLGLKVDERDCYPVVPWHGGEDGERGEDFAARLHTGTGCLVADRRSGRVVELERTKVARTA